MFSWEILLAAAALALVVAAAVVTLWRRHRVGAPRGAPDLTTGAGPAGDRLRDGLQATRRKLVGQLDTILGRSTGQAAGVLADVEEALIGADVGVSNHPGAVTTCVPRSAPRSRVSCRLRLRRRRRRAPGSCW